MLETPTRPAVHVPWVVGARVGFTRACSLVAFFVSRRMAMGEASSSVGRVVGRSPKEATGATIGA